MSNVTEMNNSGDSKMQSATEIMEKVFDDLRGNRPTKFLDSDLSCSLKLHRRYASLPNISKELILDGEVAEVNLQSARRGWKSMPNMALQTTTTAVDEQYKKPLVPSAEFKVSTDLPYTVSSTDSAVITPGSTEVIDIDTSVSPTSTPVKPVIDFSSLQDSVPQLIGDASESENSLTKLPGHETASVEMITGGDDAVVMDKAAIVTTPRRHSMWRRTMKFAQRICCCGANSADIEH